MIGAPFACRCNLYKFIWYDNLMRLDVKHDVFIILQISIKPCTFYTSILW
jgi:hypothetical protein